MNKPICDCGACQDPLYEVDLMIALTPEGADG